MKKLLQAVFLPPVRFRWIFGICSFILLFIVFFYQLTTTPLAYASFLASSLGLYYLITVTIVPLCRWTKAQIMKNPYLARYFTDPFFHARCSLCISLVINILYALLKFITGIRLQSSWLIALGIYYAVLILLRSSLILQDLRFRRNEQFASLQRAAQIELQWRTYFITGCLMLLLNVALSGITVQVVSQGKGFYYPGNMIYVIAAYSFYRITVATIHLFRNEANDSPIFSASEAIDFCFAVTSMFTLQIAMFASFSPDLDVRIPNILTGTCVAVIITAVSLYMIVRYYRHGESQ